MVGLHAYNMLLLLRGQNGWHGIVAIHSFERDVSAYPQWLVLNIFCLVIVEIQISVWGHDDIMVLSGSLYAATFATP